MKKFAILGEDGLEFQLEGANVLFEGKPNTPLIFRFDLGSSAFYVRREIPSDEGLFESIELSNKNLTEMAPTLCLLFKEEKINTIHISEEDFPPSVMKDFEEDFDKNHIGRWHKLFINNQSNDEK